MLGERIASESEVIRAIVSGYSPCCGFPHQAIAFSPLTRCVPKAANGLLAARGYSGHLMLRERIGPQFEVTRAIVLEDSPCCGVPHLLPRAGFGLRGLCWPSVLDADSPITAMPITCRMSVLNCPLPPLLSPPSVPGCSSRKVAAPTTRLPTRTSSVRAVLAAAAYRGRGGADCKQRPIVHAANMKCPPTWWP